MSLAPEVASYLVEIATQDRAFAYFQIAPDGRLLDWGGDIARYQLQNLQPGDEIEAHLFFLTGFFPLDEAKAVLPAIHMEAGLIADVHLISGAQASWVLLLDTTATMEQQQRLQQKGNDLSLLRHQYNKLLNQCLALQQSTAPQEVLDPPLASNQKDISVLLVRICDLTEYSQKMTPAVTLRTLNAYISQITQVIIEEGGVINHILGETAVALFGLLPGQQPAPQQAVHAARRITRQFQDPDSLRISKAAVVLGIASGITTGNATAGVVRNQGQASLNAIGTHVYHATQLTPLLDPGSLLVDGPTFRALAELQTAFEAIAPPALIGIPELYRSILPTGVREGQT